MYLCIYNRLLLFAPEFPLISCNLSYDSVTKAVKYCIHIYKFTANPIIALVNLKLCGRSRFVMELRNLLRSEWLRAGGKSKSD